MTIKNLKISQKLMPGFGAVIALMIVIAALAHTKLGVLNDDLKLINTDLFPKTALANTAAYHPGNWQPPEPREIGKIFEAEHAT